MRIRPLAGPGRGMRGVLGSERLRDVGKQERRPCRVCVCVCVCLSVCLCMSVWVGGCGWVGLS